MTIKNKKLILILLTLAFFLLAYGHFFKFHLVSDAYRIIDTPSKFIINLKCNEGRLIQVFYFTLFSFFNISLNSIDIYLLLYTINLTISIILLTLCALLVYNILSNNIKNITIQKRITIFLCSILLFINLTISEYLLYLENFILIFGLLLAIIATYTYMSKIKFKYAIILSLLLISSFCYQPCTQIFVSLSAIVILIKKEYNTPIDCLKYFAKILLLYLIAMALNYLFTWILNYLIPHLDPRIFIGESSIIANIFSKENLFTILIYFLISTFLIVINIKTLSYQNFGVQLLYVILLIILLCISFTILILGSNISFYCRIILNFTILYPLFKVYIISLKANNTCFKDIILTSSFLLLQLALLINVQQISIESTSQNINIVKQIIEEINEYENKNNVQINNIAFYQDSNINYEFWNAHSIIYFPYSAPIYYGYWCDIYSINTLSGKNLTRITNFELDKDIFNYFLSKDWHFPNLKEQIIFKGNTAHICKF